MSYTSLRYHIITSTKHRAPLITERLERYLFTALRRKIAELGGKAFILNGYHDHVHIVVAIPATIAVAHFVGQVKAHASRVLRKRGFEFGWQDGFAAFTVSAHEMSELIDYVYRQKEHHAEGTTREGFEPCDE